MNSERDGHDSESGISKTKDDVVSISLHKLGLAISSRRAEKGLSQEELATNAGVHRSYISEIERGQRNFTIKVLARIAECLEVSMALLLKEALETENKDRVD